MKRLIIIIGDSGVGKSSVAELLNSKLECSVYFDCDWSCVESPHFLNARQIVDLRLKNTESIITNYISYQAIQTIILTWNLVFHGIHKIIKNCKTIANIYIIRLFCNLSQRKIRLGNRVSPQLLLCKPFNGEITMAVDTSNIDVKTVVERIYNLVKNCT